MDEESTMLAFLFDVTNLVTPKFSLCFWGTDVAFEFADVRVWIWSSF